MKKIIYTFSIALSALIFTQCADWTTPEKMYEEPVNSNTEDYYRALREYKKTDHSICFESSSCKEDCLKAQTTALSEPTHQESSFEISSMSYDNFIKQDQNDIIDCGVVFLQGEPQSIQVSTLSSLHQSVYPHIQSLPTNTSDSPQVKIIFDLYSDVFSKSNADTLPQHVHSTVLSHCNQAPRFGTAGSTTLPSKKLEPWKPTSRKTLGKVSSGQVRHQPALRASSSRRKTALSDSVSTTVV